METNSRHNASHDRPLKIQQDVLDHLQICEDAITVAAKLAVSGQPLTPDAVATLKMLSNTRVTPGAKVDDN